MISESLKRRIAALRDKTTARGCTEAEALAAAEKAAALMRDHGLTEADIVIDEQATKTRTKGSSPRDVLWRALAACTNTATIIVEGEDNRRVFIGREPGPEIACYLYVVLDRAIEREIAAFKAGTFYRRRRNVSTKRQAVHDFTVGLVFRLRDRLQALFADAISIEAGEAALSARNERYPLSTSVRSAKTASKFDGAVMSGWMAGQNVSLSRGVSQGGQPALLLGGAE